LREEYNHERHAEPGMVTTSAHKTGEPLMKKWMLSVGLGLLLGAAGAVAGEAYPLTTCPVSGAALENGGVAKEYDGREVRFCCPGCPASFEEDVEASLAKVDEAIIEDQKPVYPIEACVVMEHDMDLEGATWFVADNRAFATCCASCARKVKAEPAEFAKALDEAAKEKQAADYPLDTCVVAGADLGENPVEFVVAGRLMRTCCAGCAGKAKAEPASFLAKLSEARE